MVERVLAENFDYDGSPDLADSNEFTGYIDGEDHMSVVVDGVPYLTKIEGPVFRVTSVRKAGSLQTACAERIRAKEKVEEVLEQYYAENKEYCERNGFE